MTEAADTTIDNATGQALAASGQIVDQMVDLGSIDTREACNKPFDLELVHPTAKTGTGVFIQIVGKDSDAYRKAIESIANENMNRDAVNSRRAKFEVQTIGKLEKKNIDALVAATVGWYTKVPVRDETGKVVSVNIVHAIALRGETIPYSPDNARRVYTDLLTMRDQVQDGVNDLENFMGK